MAGAKGLLLALGMPKEKGKAEAKEPEADDEDEGSGEHTDEQLEAGQALADAAKAGDGKGVVTAFKALWMLCDDDGEEEPPASGKYG
jgi:hypothetical protein